MATLFLFIMSCYVDVNLQSDSEEARLSDHLITWTDFLLTNSGQHLLQHHQLHIHLLVHIRWSYHSVNLDLINTTLLDMTRFGAFQALLNAECSLYLEISQTSCCPTSGRYWNPADPQSLPWKRIKEVFLIFQLFVLEIIKCMRNWEQIDGNDLPSQN